MKSDETSGIDIVTVKALIEINLALISPKVAPNNYLAALAYTLGHVAAHATTSKERLREYIFKAAEDAFDLERERVLAVPEARAKLAEWESSQNRDSVN